METWKQVPILGYEKLYKISSAGRVYSVRGKTCLTPKLSTPGYYRVTLSSHGIKNTISIHRLVALAFIPNPQNKPTVNHINEIKTDNRVENLEWATIAEQNRHGTRTQRAIAHTDYKNRGIDYKQVAAHHDYSRQNMCGRKAVIVWNVLGNKPIFIGEFPSQKDASIYTEVCESKVSQCVLGQKKSCKGFSFEMAKK